MRRPRSLRWFRDPYTNFAQIARCLASERADQPGIVTMLSKEKSLAWSSVNCEHLAGAGHVPGRADEHLSRNQLVDGRAVGGRHCGQENVKEEVVVINKEDYCRSGSWFNSGCIVDGIFQATGILSIKQVLLKKRVYPAKCDVFRLSPYPLLARPGKT